MKNGAALNRKFIRLRTCVKGAWITKKNVTRDEGKGQLCEAAVDAVDFWTRYLRSVIFEYLRVHHHKFFPGTVFKLIFYFIERVVTIDVAVKRCDGQSCGSKV